MCARESSESQNVFAAQARGMMIWRPACAATRQWRWRQERYEKKGRSVRADRLLACATDSNRAGNVSKVRTGGSVTLLDLIRELNAILGTNAEPTFAAARAGDVRDSRAKIGRIRA
jgi:hypothetical protein